MHFLEKYQVVEFHTRHLSQKQNGGFKKKIFFIFFFYRILLSDLQMKRQRTEKNGFHDRMKHILLGCQFQDIYMIFQKVDQGCLK